MDLPKAGTDVLAQPTRARIFSWLAEHRAPASTERLASMLEMHPNGVRRHLERMHGAGLIERSPGKSGGGRGRPGDMWVIAPGADPSGEPPTGYTDLAGWLARAIPANRSRLREVEAAGREIGRDLAPDGAGDGVEGFRHALASLGFRPEVELSGEEGFVCRLENCPYRDSVRENQVIVCALHKGITSGLLTRLLPETRLARFEPRDPDDAGCLIDVAGSIDGDET